jgi:hypothetical protein
MFDQLMEEVKVLNWHFGWVGCFDAIKYMSEHREEYAGTAVYKQIGVFMRQGAEMFKEVA